MNIIVEGYSPVKTKNIKIKIEKYLKLLRIYSKLNDHTIYLKGTEEKSENYGCFDVPISRKEDDKTVKFLEIKIYKNSIKSQYMFLRTIFHELVHLKQYVKGELV